jgi:hypothetical protein
MSINKKYFYVNSQNRISGTSSNFTYNLDITDLDVTEAIIMNMTIPKSFYLVNASNCTFTLVTSNGNHTITMPVGNYTRRNFATNLVTQLNLASSYVFSVTFPGSSSPDTGKYTYTVTGNSGFQPSFIFTDQLYEQLGFEHDSTNVFVANTLISTNVINLQIKSTLFLHSDMITNHDSNILQEISSVTSSSFSNMVYSNNTLDASNKITHLSSTVNFYLTDEDGNPIDLNGLNFEFTLFLFRPDDTLINTAKLFTYNNYVNKNNTLLGKDPNSNAN